MIKRFEYLPKTADVRFRAFGNSIEQLLENSALAMINVMVDYKKVRKVVEKKIFLKASNLENLMIKFLEEILFLLDTEGFLTAEIKEMNLNKNPQKYELRCVLLGDNNLKNYELSSGVKAVTYNDLTIKKLNSKYVAEVTLDT
ncbi:MAG: hypothetical protein DRP57_11705 [Spirochaetes bacterium]|nr:MAG: hypothetical protein DRP57_11705 [Spirochaetota bacterium]